MAYFRAAIGGGGGGETETTLWTNPNPTSNMISETVTLSDDLTNYKYLRIEWRRTTSDDTKASMRVLSSEFKSFDSSATSPKFLMGSGTTTYSARAVVYASDTSVSFSQCRQVNGTGSVSSGCIPTKITGIN